MRDDGRDAGDHGLAGLDMGREIGGIALRRAETVGQGAVAFVEGGAQADDRPLGGGTRHHEIADRLAQGRFIGLHPGDAPAQAHRRNDAGDEQHGNEDVGCEGDEEAHGAVTRRCGC